MYTYIHYSGAVIHTLFKSVAAKSGAPAIELCTCKYTDKISYK